MNKIKLKESSNEPIAMSRSNIYIHKMGMDTNGNSVVYVSLGGNKPFTIQTNGNLKISHELASKGIKKPSDIQKIGNQWMYKLEDEIIEYIEKYSSPKIKSLLKVYS